MYILKSSIIHLFSYDLYTGVVQGVRPPLGTKNLFLLFANLQNIGKIKLESKPPFLKILDPPLNDFNDYLYSVNAIEILNLKTNWTPSSILVKDISMDQAT
jgi:hypothetical protein